MSDDYVQEMIARDHLEVPTEHTDLVMRLKDRSQFLWTTEKQLQDNKLAREAADRIEELEAKLATCEKYRDAYDKMGRIGTEAYRDLEAKLAKAVEALKFYAYVDDDQGIRARKILEEMGVMDYE